jgi:hypothetical protein
LADRLTYNFKFDSSEITLNKAIAYKPDRPEAYLIKSKIYLWYYLGRKDSSDYDLFKKYSDSTIAKFEELMEENSDQPDLLYLAGNIYKYRAMAFGSIGNTLDAFWSTKNAVSFYEDVIDIDSSYYSAFGGIGIFEYALSYVPALFNWALVLSGLTADKNNGFEYIELAAEKADKDKIEYKFHLSKLLDEHLAEYESALSILKELVRMFPENQLFHYQAAIQLIKLKKLDEALRYLENVQRISHPKFIQTYSFSNFLIGDIYFRKKEYKQALIHYKSFLTSTKTIDYTGIASLRSAFSHYFLGDDKEYTKYLMLASTGNLDIEEDNMARNVSLELLENGMSKSREFLINLENDFLAGNNDSLISISKSIIDSINNNDITSQIYIYRSSVFIEENLLQDAKNSLASLESLGSDLTGWVLPMKYFNLAKINYIENNYILVNKYLDLAESENDYYKQKEIQSYINGLRRKIKPD